MESNHCLQFGGEEDKDFEVDILTQDHIGRERKEINLVHIGHLSIFCAEVLDDTWENMNENHQMSQQKAVVAVLCLRMNI